eukprot:2614433-Pleurochrysis_carterae.AAC.1
MSCPSRMRLLGPRLCRCPYAGDGVGGREARTACAHMTRCGPCGRSARTRCRGKSAPTARP